MNKPGHYVSIATPSEGMFKEKGSKFIAFAYPVSSEEEIKLILKELKKKYHDARHHCYAWRLGPDPVRTRANDDGEPSGTAGKPILGRIESFDLNNILIVVVRYFGGTLLGTNGLVRAYRTAASGALEKAQLQTVTMTVQYLLSFPYTMMNGVMKILKDHSLKPLHPSYDVQCTLGIEIPQNRLEKVIKQLSTLDNIKIEPADL